MKAKNSKDVMRGYTLFTIAILCAIVLGFFCIWSFFYTANREVAAMELRSRGYDDTYMKQIMLAEKVDSLYNYILLLNSEQRYNELVLKNRISAQKMNLQKMLNEMDKSDAALYNKLYDQINVVLQTKDSVRLMNGHVEQIKAELQACIKENKIATRNMIINNTTN